ncbi:MAG: glycosyl hydrolase, partial [Clostridia bacterium]|nr:glycosyl hydrolase [Clostridia bacterium]
GDQPECSDYFAKDGWYYLIFSHRGRGQYRISRRPFSDWQMPENPDIPCESVPKMALWNGRILFTGFHRIDGYAGTLTFTEAWQESDGSLRFGSPPVS